MAEGHGTVHPRQPAGRPPVRRPAPTYGGDLRRDLLDAALELIAREGPSAVSLRWLARRLGVSHAAPANHFPDKAALFTAIATEGFELLGAAITEAGQRFRATGRAYTGFALDHPALAAASDATFALLLAGVRDVQAEGWAAGADPQTVAFLAWSVVHGLATLWLSGSLDHAGRPFDEIPAEVGALLGRTLAAHPGPAADA